jgi:hypothetical protein
MTIHVRWPGQTSGPDSYPDGLALIFLVLFASRGNYILVRPK